MKIIQFLCIALCVYHTVNGANIVFLHGSSGVGKTSLCRALQQVNSGWRIVNENNIPAESKKLNTSNLNNAIISQIHNYARMGYNVIVDTESLPEEQCELFRKHFNVVIVLVYCPLKTLIERTKERNHTALSNKNFSAELLHQMFMSFSKQYDVTLEEKIYPEEKTMPQEIIHSIDAIALQDVMEAFNCIENSMEEPCTELQLVKQKMIEQFNNQPQCYITPQLKFDIVLRTDTQNPHECAVLLNNIIQQYSFYPRK